MQSFWESIKPGARLGLGLGVGVLVLATVVALWWLFRPGYQLLFTDLAGQDAAEISASLKAWKVPHQFAQEGRAIEVPADLVYDTRMRLLSEGVPSGGHVGFEIFDDADFGATEFAQRINFQRALQGEIERTIAALPGVQSCRVHLSIRRPGMFLGGQDASKASVALQLVPGATLDARQVGGIRNLVAAAVDGLSPSSVVVMGPDGALLASTEDQEAGPQGRISRQSDYELRLQERIENLLAGAFEFDQLRVTVNAQLNFDEIREVHENPVPLEGNGHGVLVRRQVSRPVGEAGGSSQEQVEYAHGTRREEIERAPGRIERLSIAILVPGVLDATNKERLSRLVAAAVGLDPSRGDTLEIGSLDAVEPALPEEETAELTQFPRDVPARVETVEKTGWPVWPHLALSGLAVLLLGMMIGWWLHPRPRRLSAQELDAVTGKLRDWLAEGA